jgi:hypothetical protein
MHNSITRKRRGLFSIKNPVRLFAILLLVNLLMIPTMSMPTYASTTVTAEEFFQANLGDSNHKPISSSNLPSYEELTDGSSDDDTDTINSAVADAFGTSAKYNAWTAKVEKYVSWVDGGSQPYTSSGDSSDATDDEWALYNSTLSSFNRAIGSSSVKSITDNIYGTGNFNVHDGFLSEVSIGIFNIISVLFSFICKVIYYFSLLFLGLDLIYLLFDVTHNFLAPNQSGGFGSHAPGESGSKWWRINWVSADAIAACDDKAGGGTGNYATGGNRFTKYIVKHFPLIMMVMIYLVLVGNNLWSTVISAGAGLITQLIVSL